MCRSLCHTQEVMGLTGKLIWFLILCHLCTVKAMIDQEVKNGIPSHRIILGGFSQVMISCSFTWSDF